MLFCFLVEKVSLEGIESDKFCGLKHFQGMPQ